MKQVRIVETQGKVTLVQWDDNENRPHRAIVPSNYVANDTMGMGMVDDEILNLGVEVGDDWEYLIGEINVTNQTIADALRRAGFWDWHDIERDPRNAQNAIDKAVGVRAATLARYARQEV